MIHTWRKHKTETHILVAGTLSFTLFLGEILIGAFQVNQTQPAGLRLLHAQTSVSVWAVLIVLFGFVLQAGQEKRAEKHISTEKNKFVWKNFFQITKPLIVLLLLFTTFTGMVTANGGMPDLSLTFITLLAGGLAAGGSGAINQYIDRHLDRQMKRTSQRPIASGKIFPAEGLAFGLGLLVISFYLMARFVHMTAALAVSCRYAVLSAGVQPDLKTEDDLEHCHWGWSRGNSAPRGVGSSAGPSGYFRMGSFPDRPSVDTHPFLVACVGT